MHAATRAYADTPWLHVQESQLPIGILERVLQYGSKKKRMGFKCNNYMPPSRHGHCDSHAHAHALLYLRFLNIFILVMRQPRFSDYKISLCRLN